MFFTASEGSRRPMELSGVGRSSQIEDLQRSLRNLARATGRSQIDPRAITGTLDVPTMTAVSAACDLLVGQLSLMMGTALQAALILGPQSVKAQNFVGMHAADLAYAANAAGMALYSQRAASDLPSFPQLGRYSWPFPLPETLVIGGVILLALWLLYKDGKAA